MKRLPSQQHGLIRATYIRWSCLRHTHDLHYRVDFKREMIRGQRLYGLPLTHRGG